MTEAPLFTPEMLRGREVHVIGVGALGSAVFQNLFRMHVETLHIWDFDTVEPRNRYNQRVYAANVGENKCDAQARVAATISGDEHVPVVLHKEKFSTTHDLAGIVIAAVDSMEARKTIWARVKNNPNVSFFADGRMGLEGGKVYAFDPSNPEHIARYEDPMHMHGDPAVPVPGACKTAFPMPALADIVAGHILWRLVRWLHLEQGCTDPYDHFIGLIFIPELVHVIERWDMEFEEISDEKTHSRLQVLTARVRALFWK